MECFELGQFLEQNLTRLREDWAHHQEALAAKAPEHYGRDAFLARRRQLKAAMRSGELTPVQFQTALARVKKSYSDHEAAAWRATQAFLTEHFPESLINVDPERQGIPILEGRLPLMSGS